MQRNECNYKSKMMVLFYVKRHPSRMRTIVSSLVIKENFDETYSEESLSSWIDMYPFEHDCVSIAACMTIN